MLKTTNLRLLRNILEGRDGRVCSEKGGMERHGDFFLQPRTVEQRVWMREKRLEARELRRKRRRQRRREAQERLQVAVETEERHLAARKAYDDWLIQHRPNLKKKKKHQVLTANTATEPTHLHNQSADTYDIWEKDKTVEAKKMAPTKDSVNNKVPSLASDEVRKQKKVSRKRPPTRRPQPAQAMQVSGTTTEEGAGKSSLGGEADLIVRLRRQKLHDRELSRRRVDTGIDFKRPITAAVPSLQRALTSYEWRIRSRSSSVSSSDSSPGSAFISQSDSRSRRVDRITHEHINPFSVV